MDEHLITRTRTLERFGHSDAKGDFTLPRVNLSATSVRRMSGEAQCSFPSESPACASEGYDEARAYPVPGANSFARAIQGYVAPRIALNSATTGAGAASLISEALNSATPRCSALGSSTNRFANHRAGSVRPDGVNANGSNPSSTPNSLASQDTVGGCLNPADVKHAVKGEFSCNLFIIYYVRISSSVLKFCCSRISTVRSVTHFFLTTGIAGNVLIRIWTRQILTTRILKNPSIFTNSLENIK